ncbi:bifunctional UDP-N-acetylmuramoyl-tripeptide:D-alanyl-D-alanine ligase/alanine racemase [Flavobacterium sp. CHNK8]|uniref:bifunctional UDP-N-acetylmuramoyl-tripeptide:D-alanyl-D-alanine ligase/alanine racemase n=1 Tax=Flavobacterium sp. CHNK8 TaxID=2871165 RepID=UPI001C8EBC11|nr:bifunctional UDP-N-acetylmuramoyl-tripeptide:D-alanyl-D-alanine ligase/alanine racemase [Flavobacterium sp. CHNK8]QZK89221.1 bifunctional UDP-N-acetylmuramoyl-tripeptide:D-alanyl-D-alanine ligase/alanine racemase [Flavobacterium sp. CHNK8]
MSQKILASLQTIQSVRHGDFDNDDLDAVSIDSRSLQNGVQTLFFALVGVQHDAHDYIDDLIVSGVQNFVVTFIPKDCEGKANFYVVSNTMTALQEFAAYYRALFQIPVIGLTGSNGKTIVKEWLNFLLAPDYNIIRSPKSYNSQVGVPLSVMAINEKHNLGIFEAGISTRGEMKNLEKIIKPTIGVLTNIGTAHDEGFTNTTEKIKEKLLLFQNADVLIYNKKETVEEHLQPDLQRFSWSFSDPLATVLVTKEVKDSNTILHIHYGEVVFDVKIPFFDEASIENAISCILVLLFLHVEVNTIQERTAQLYPVEMRLKLKNGINNCNIIDDSYSSDFQSLKIALDFLENQKQSKKKTLILSDIFQSGLSLEELYDKVSHLIKVNNIDRVIAIGETISRFQYKFTNALFYKTTAEFIADIAQLDFYNETILIKGARVFQFEEIVYLLEEKTHETVLEINLNAITHNLNFFKAKLKPNVKIMVMVKAFGYGNGGLEIAKLLEFNKVNYLGVAFADEGIALKKGGIKVPIMVLNPESTSFSAIIKHKLEPEIYSLKGLYAFLKIAKQKGLENFPIHIKMDTGMHRLGFEAATIDELILALQGNKTVQVKSILSHLATSDDPSQHDFARSQITLFEQLSSKLMAQLPNVPLRHILNTSGISNFMDSQYDMVRLGIGLYGVSNDSDEQLKLENVGTLKSIISQLRIIKTGESVGYGRRFVASKDTVIATIPIGYADGISRGLGNGVGHVLVRNTKAAIVGSVCMDMLMVDVTGIDCKEGDVVVLFGEQLRVNEIAEKLNTIPYEILTNVSQRVKRVFYRE